MMKRAEFLLGQFKGSPDVADPKIYVQTIAIVLSDYPEDVVMKATDPRTGIAREQQWHPTPHELSKFCDKLAEPARREAARQQRDAEARRFLANPENRKPWRGGDDDERLTLAAPEPAPRKTLAELQAACAARGGMVPQERRGSPVPKELTDAEKDKLLADLAERAKQPCGVKPSPELLAKLAEERE